MKLISLTIALSVAALTTGFAQGAAPAPKLDSVDQIIDRYIAAVGGPGLKKLTSIQVRGTVEIPNLNINGTVEISQKQPAKSLQVITLGPAGTQREGFDGTVAWAEDPQNGVREKTGLEAAEARRGSLFPRELRIKELYPKMEVTGREKVGEREAFVITGTPTEGEPVRLFFDVQSGLLIRQIATTHGPGGPAMQVDVSFEDYKPVDGVQRAHVIRQATQQFTAIIRAVEIKHNVAIDDAVFRKPG